MFEIDKRIISVFTFGFLLILVGVTGRFMNWAQAQIILATGLLFETVAVLMFAWNKIKGK
jgi:hypothetical protein